MGGTPINLRVKVGNIECTFFGYPLRRKPAVNGKKAAHSGKAWRILIVDDHPLVRAGLAGLVGGEPDLEVCGETGDISDAMELARTQAPDMMIIDLSLANGNGLELVKRIRAYDEAIKMLVCSMHDEALFAYRALNAGAMGYIGKEEATEHVIDAIRHVLKDKIWLSAKMTERALQGIAQGGRAKAGTIDSLSDRELEVFGLIGRGMGPSEIAEQLHLSIKTIETHRENIKKKLNLRSGSELVRLALHWTYEQS